MSLKAICVHGHFYQPPREDPITGKIPFESGASPYKNWNERIHAECYRPNAELGNFEHISFNVGPTLFRWLSVQEPVTYQHILDQDKANVRRFGVGNAIAQAFNHTILPLATTADKIIQIGWGIADFEHRFGRKPQGMWLPETAMDLETLSILARYGIEFVVLAPWQAEETGLDLTEPYHVALPDGESITVFFYDGELSSGVSFNPSLTDNADQFANNNVVPHFHGEKERQGDDQMLLLASDGELYGHHQPFRERFLAHLMNGASKQAGITPIFPALWLKSHPPRRTIRLRENTAWSCHHGVTRWMGDCDCTPGAGRWKSHLRKALDQLAVTLDGVYFDQVYHYIPKPRQLRERYVEVLLGKTSAEKLINEAAGQALPSEPVLRIQLLLRSQYERQRMYTSCGWFFDDFDRIEPKNNLAYAAQAVRLVHLATGEDLSPQVIRDLKQVSSPRTGLRGDTVFKRHLERTWVIKEKGIGGSL
jgi:alpha-amylase/alpha-mannosidase (GH57 family)